MGFWVRSVPEVIVEQLVRWSLLVQWSFFTCVCVYIYIYIYLSISLSTKELTHFHPSNILLKNTKGPESQENHSRFGGKLCKLESRGFLLKSLLRRVLSCRVTGPALKLIDPQLSNEPGKSLCSLLTVLPWELQSHFPLPLSFVCFLGQKMRHWTLCVTFSTRWHHFFTFVLKALCYYVVQPRVISVLHFLSNCYKSYLVSMKIS